MILHVIFVLAAVGIILWAVNKFVPMAAPIRQVMNIAVVIVVVLWLLRVTGIADLTHEVHP